MSQTNDDHPTPPPPDALSDRLRALRRAELDDITSARTLARAETALRPPSALSRPHPRARGWLVPAALGAWALLYLWGALAELARLYPGSPTRSAPAVASALSPVTIATAGVGYKAESQR